MWKEKDIKYLEEHFSYEDYEVMEKYLGKTKSSIVHKANRIGLNRMKDFSREDDAWLIDNFSEATNEELTKKFSDFSLIKILNHANFLGLKRDPSFHVFTKDDDEILRKYFGKIDTKDICLKYLPGVKIGSIYARAKRLGLPVGVFWTEEMDKILIENYTTMRMKPLVALLGVKSSTPVYNRMKQLGLKNKFHQRKWTEEDDLFLENNFRNKSDAEIAVILNRTEKAILTRRKTKKLAKTIEETHYTDFRKLCYANSEKWRQEIRENFNNKCFLTDDYDCDIHHITGVSIIIEECLKETGISLNTDPNVLSNEERNRFLCLFLEKQSNNKSILISKSIHTLFHKKYGFGNNTKEQFLEFVKENYESKIEDLNKYLG